MANIRVDINYTIKDGSEVVFRSPVDCSQVTGLIVYYPGDNEIQTSKEFALADAHGNNVGDIDHLFAENVVVKVILDTTTNMAFVQNADTNAYLEKRFRELDERLDEGVMIAEDPNKDGNIVMRYAYLSGGGGSSGESSGVSIPKHKLLDLEVEQSTASVV